eukprot:g29051.t1
MHVWDELPKEVVEAGTITFKRHLDRYNFKIANSVIAQGDTSAQLTKKNGELEEKKREQDELQTLYHHTNEVLHLPPYLLPHPHPRPQEDF